MNGYNLNGDAKDRGCGVSSTKKTGSAEVEAARRPRAVQDMANPSFRRPSPGKTENKNDTVASCWIEPTTGRQPIDDFEIIRPIGRKVMGELYFIFFLAFLPTQIGAADCNGNDIGDALDIEDGTSVDCNKNGIPDECEVLATRTILGPKSIPLPGAEGTYWIAPADFDGDGRLDLAVTGRSSNAALLSRKGGTFEAHPFDTGGEYDFLIAADFNGDGRTDLVAGSTALWGNGPFLRNDGKGNFTRTGMVPWARVAADLDGDGDIDIVQPDGGWIAVHWNDGKAKFIKGPSILLSDLQFVTAAAAVDIDLDGKLDVAAGFGTQTARLVGILNRGTDFVPGSPMGLNGQEVTDLLVRDFDGDGRHDVAVAVRGNNGVPIFGGAADGSFIRLTSPSPGGVPFSLASADFDGDGTPDISTSNNEDGTVGILLARGPEKFQALPSVPAGASPWGIAAGDFDGDGLPDVAVASLFEGSVSILWNGGGGVFPRGGRYRVGDSPSSLVACDLNGDGRKDLAVTCRDEQSLSVLLASPPSKFQGPRSISMTKYPTDSAAGDFDGDGLIDVAVASSGYMQDPSVLTIFQSVGDGTLKEIASCEYVVKPWSLATADVDGDGDLDLAAAGNAPYAVTVFRNEGKGTFTRLFDIGIEQSPSGIVAVDLNGDGGPDLAVSAIGNDSASGSVWTIANRGDFAFAGPEKAASFVKGAWAIAAVDLDRDGSIELIAGGMKNALPGDGFLAVLWPVAAGGFMARTIDTAPATYPHSIVPCDLDGDGWDDLVASDVLNGSISLWKYDGTGGLFRMAMFSAGSAPAGIAVADFDGDGHLDLASANAQSDDVTVIFLIDRDAPPTSEDCDKNGVPDECEPDCNGNAIPDSCDMASGDEKDCNGNDVPDSCEIRSGTATDCNSNGIPDECDISNGNSSDRKGGNPNGVPDECERTSFHRGDGNGDGEVDISDAVCMIQYLFLGGGSSCQKSVAGGGGRVSCFEAADSNNDGTIDCSDAIFIFNYLFLGGDVPASPGPPPHPCGSDTDPLGSKGDLGCDSYIRC